MTMLLKFKTHEGHILITPAFSFEQGPEHSTIHVPWAISYLSHYTNVLTNPMGGPPDYIVSPRKVWEKEPVYSKVYYFNLPEAVFSLAVRYATQAQSGVIDITPDGLDTLEKTFPAEFPKTPLQRKLGSISRPRQPRP